MAVLPSRSRTVSRLVAATLLVAIGGTLQVFAGALDAVCPAVYPAPASCSADLRGILSLTGGAVIAVSYLSVVAASIVLLRGGADAPSSASAVVRLAGAILGGASIVFPLAAALSGGFGVDLSAIVMTGIALVSCVALTVMIVRPEGRTDRSGEARATAFR